MATRVNMVYGPLAISVESWSYDPHLDDIRVFQERNVRIFCRNVNPAAYMGRCRTTGVSGYGDIVQEFSDVIDIANYARHSRQGASPLSPSLAVIILYVHFQHVPAHRQGAVSSYVTTLLSPVRAQTRPPNSASGERTLNYLRKWILQFI